MSPAEKDGWKKKKKKKAGRRVNFARVTGLKRELFYSGVKRRGGEGEGGEMESRGEGTTMRAWSDKALLPP